MSIRFRLMTVVVAIILVANSLLSLVTLQYLSRVWLAEVQTRVRRNLNSAHAAYQKQVELIAAFLQGAALNGTLSKAMRDSDHATVEAALRDIHGQGKTDFLVLLDATGRVVCRGRAHEAGEDLSADPLVASVLAAGRTATGTVIFNRERLLREMPDLAAKAQFEVIQTPAARPTSDKTRTDGMIVAAAVRIDNSEGSLLGVLYGGTLINRRFDTVDAIKQEVFPQEVYRGKDIGTVTIFQGDMRIATNVLMDDGSRAVGTRLSASVCEVVLDAGRIWAGPAFVVNDWYITAYEPIRDPTGRVVGSLYVGLLRAPFVDQRNVISAVFLAVVLGTTLASVVLLLIANELVLGPIRHVVTMAQRVIGGDMTARVGIRPPGEMGILCRAVDSMAHAVAEREELRKLATQQQIGRSEQLASVGRLAAGVAHEINNPLVGVLAFADMMREKPNLDDQDREDLALIIRETKRVREIVRGLLDFARETPSVRSLVNVNDILRQTILLLGKRDAFESIYIVEDLAESLPPVVFDKSQLQQVFINLALNACEAMPNGGTLVINSKADDGSVVVEITDTGCGIKKEHLQQIFEPFFTTKPVGKGTGLGLAVSYGIIQQHGGALEVDSEIGRGSTFRVVLPVAPPEG